MRTVLLTAAIVAALLLAPLAAYAQTAAPAGSIERDAAGALTLKVAPDNRAVDMLTAWIMGQIKPGGLLYWREMTEWRLIDFERRASSAEARIAELEKRPAATPISYESYFPNGTAAECSRQSDGTWTFQLSTPDASRAMRYFVLFVNGAYVPPTEYSRAANIVTPRPASFSSLDGSVLAPATAAFPAGAACWVTYAY